MAVNDIYQLAVRGVANGQQHVHTLHFRENVATSGSPEDVLIDDWQGACRTAYRNLFQADNTPVLVIVAARVAAAGALPVPVERAEAGATQVGTRTVAGDSLPPWLACVNTVRTGLAGRRHRGRYFLGGLREADQDGGVLNSTYIALAQAYADTLKGRFMPPSSISNFGLGVFSRLTWNGGAGGLINSFTPATTIVPRNLVASMRSRKAGHGL